MYRVAGYKGQGIGQWLVWWVLALAVLTGCSRSPDAVPNSSAGSKMSGSIPVAVRALTTANCSNLLVDVVIDGDTLQPVTLRSVTCDTNGNFTGTLDSTRAIGTHNYALLYYINDPKFNTPVQVANYPSVQATVSAGGSAALEFTPPDTNIDTSGDNITNVDELNLGLNPFVKNTFTLSVAVSGLGTAGLVLNNGADVLSIDSDGTYTFSTPLLNTDPYNVTVGTQATGFICGVTNNSGTMGTANVTLSVACAAGKPPNAAPNGVINTPAGNISILRGTSLSFTGTGTNPDNNLPLSFAWDFGGGAPNSTLQNPGDVTFNTVGTYTVSLTVKDSQGLSDPTPAMLTVTVLTSHTVTTTAGTGGTISPSSTIVGDGSVTDFTVTPNTGYGIASVSGCNGSLSGNVYTTGAITADCTVTASFFLQLGAVSPLFPLYGANWNDYVMPIQGGVAACDGANGSFCVHGGGLRIVTVTGKSDCAGLTAADDLGAFTWVCDGSTSPVRMISLGLADNKYLSDLIDFSRQAFKVNKVTVYDSAGIWGETPRTSWWTNPVRVNNIGGSLAIPSTIYLVTRNLSVSYTLDADKVALVMQPGVMITGPGSNAVAITGAAHNYQWIEGTIDATGDTDGVDISRDFFSVLRNLVVSNATQSGVYLLNGVSIVLKYVTANNNGNNGIFLSKGSNNFLLNLSVANNGGNGIYIDSSSNNTLSDLAVANNLNGIDLASSSNNSLSKMTVANNDGNGISLDGSNNTLSDLTVANNSVNGIFLYGSNNTLSDLTVANNYVNGIFLDGSNNTLSDLTVANNSVNGITLGSNNTASDLTIANNGNDGITLGSNNTLSDLAVANNGYDGITLNGSNNVFTSLLKVGNNINLDCDPGVGTISGLDSNCANNGNSDSVLFTGITLANTFVGKVTSDDVKNTSDVLGTVIFPTYPATFDWTHFDDSYRSWGIDGGVFPSMDQQGQWITGMGRIWDWSLLASDTINKGVLPVPNGNDTLTQVWSGVPATNDDSGCNAMVAGSTYSRIGCQTTFLRNAVEIEGDGIGNDNALCESGETCLYTPNIGSYQGHGRLVSAGPFSPGVLTGITLMKNGTNGR